MESGVWSMSQEQPSGARKRLRMSKNRAKDFSVCSIKVHP
jgi:hypothetical protein